MDAGHRETDKKLEEIEKRISAEYRKAEKDIQKTLDDYLRRFETKDKLKQKALAEGKITEEEYKQWRIGQMMIGQRWNATRDRIVNDLNNASQEARNIAFNQIGDIYAANFNYGTYQVEKAARIDTDFTLYDKDAVRELMKNEDTFIPAPGRKVRREINEGKQKAWDKRQVQSVMMQGILQGKSIPKLASDLAETVGEADRKAAIRNARTMVTGVQNAGRVASYERANEMGIETQKQWLAALDDRTRHWHAELDGEKVDNDEPFVNEYGEIMYPGDPTADPANIFNCRCTLIASIKGFERDVSDIGQRNDKLGDMSYEDWKAGHYEQKSDSITKQENIANAMEQSYTNEYTEIARSQLEADEGLVSDIIERAKEVIGKPDNYGDVDEILSEYPRIQGSHTYLDDTKAINPDYIKSCQTKDGRYTTNCQRCVIAYEARRRGYDVIAKPKLEAKDALSDMFNKNGWANAFKNGRIGLTHITSERNYGARRKIVNKLLKWGDGSRAIVRVKMNEAAGHVFIAENIKGKVVFVDPQRNVTDCNLYFDHIVRGETWLLRTDDKKFTSLIVQCCEPRLKG